MKVFLNKNIVITGGASGIGKELVRLCAREGSNIAIIDVNEKALKKIEHEMADYSAKILGYYCDLASKTEIDETVEKIKNDFIEIDILINNAGVISGKTIAELSYEEIKLTLDVNLLGVIWLTKKFLPDMMDRNQGHIVNVSSAAGLISSPKMGDYSASKYGVIGFSETLRMELNKSNLKGVKLTVVCPSLTKTGMFNGFKPPLFNPSLEPEYVAEKIIHAVKKEKYYLKLPFLVKTIGLFKLLPVSWLDKVCELLGVTRTMDNFSKQN